MQTTVPREALAILSTLVQAGYSAEIVGGAVRDLVIGRATTDWDFTTNATPEQIQALFPENFYENAFGTVGVARSHLNTQFGWESTAPEDEVFEITTYRSESSYSDHRRPDAVHWGQTLDEDLARRDFTMNALAAQMSVTDLQALSPDDLQKLPETVEVELTLLDPYQGLADIAVQKIRTVGEPVQRFSEDALRMLRAVRFAAQLGYSLDLSVLLALQTQAGDIAHVSWERIRDEFLKILVTDYVEQALTLLATTGILKYILPELLTARGIEQRGHHEYDVWHHSLRACAACPSRDPIVRFATLLHDIAKPETQAPLAGSEGEYTFFNHEVVGARLARDIAKRFRLSQDDVQRVFTLVRWHMFHYQPSMTDAAIRRFIRRIGVEAVDDMMALREADRVGSGSKRTSWRLEEMKQRIHEQLHQPMQVRDMVVKGEDVMEVLGIPPSRRVGEVLNELFEEVIDDPEKNTREYLLTRLAQMKV